MIRIALLMAGPQVHDANPEVRKCVIASV